METQKSNHAKFTFFYLLSLVALGFVAFSTGSIIFQIINKYIVDIFDTYSGQFSDGALRFAISSLIVAVPIYYLVMSYIQKNLKNGLLDKESVERKWMIYLILFVSFAVSIGWLIGLLNSFLNGELTTKFVLKFITIMVLMGIVFSYYFYDVKRKEVKSEKDKVLIAYFWASLSIVVITLISAFFVMESPADARGRRADDVIISSFSRISYDIDVYYGENNKLPESLEVLKKEFSYGDEVIMDLETKKVFDYNVLGDRNYELCATFRTSNQDINSPSYYVGNEWRHGKGYECLERTARTGDTKPTIIK